MPPQAPVPTSARWGYGESYREKSQRLSPLGRGNDTRVAKLNVHNPLRLQVSIQMMLLVQEELSVSG